MKLKKKITLKKWDSLYKHQALMVDDKNFNPGKLDFTKLAGCKSRTVNFFGDVHTEVFSLKVSADDQFVGAACSNG